VAAQAKVDAQLEKQAAAERRLQQNEAGFADANKTKAASLRDARNAYQATYQLAE